MKYATLFNRKFLKQDNSNFKDKEQYDVIRNNIVENIGQHKKHEITHKIYRFKEYN